MYLTIEPQSVLNKSREVSTTHWRQIEAAHSTELYGQALKKDGNNVRQQNDEKETKAPSKGAEHIVHATPCKTRLPRKARHLVRRHGRFYVLGSPLP